MIKLFRDTDIGGSLSGGPDPIPEDVRKKIEEKSELTDFGKMYEKLNERYPLRDKFEFRKDYIKYRCSEATEYEINCAYSTDVQIPNNRDREVYVDGWMDCYKLIVEKRSLPTIQAQEERIRVLEEALRLVVWTRDLTDEKTIVSIRKIASQALTPKTNKP